MKSKYGFFALIPSILGEIKIEIFWNIEIGHLIYYPLFSLLENYHKSRKAKAFH